MVKVYGENDLVMCIKNPHNVEGLIVGRLYLVKSATPLLGDWVYGVKGASEQVIYSIDNFQLIVSADGCQAVADQAKKLIYEELEKIEKEKIEEESKMETPKLETTTWADRVVPAGHDPVNSPSHYTQGGIETIDVLEAKLGEEGFKGFLKGNIIKYVTRAGLKVDTIEDLKKAGWYLNKLITTLGGTPDVKVETIVKEVVVTPEFSRGDKVQCLKDYDENRKAVGKEGQVLKVYGDYVTVEFFDNINGHSESGLGKYGHCWNFPATGGYLEVTDRRDWYAKCTKKQRGYIYGLCKKLRLDPRDLPDYVSPVHSETRDLTETQASEVIDKLLALEGYRVEKGLKV